MKTHASYIYSAYSFINSLSEESLSQIGNLEMNGIPIPSFDEELLISLCEDVTYLFKNEDNIIEVDGDAIVVGDIHGSFHDLLRIIQYIDKIDSKVIFLGDYVDRGSFSLESITLLFSLKILNPNKIYLLRGNHEFSEMCSHYGFKKEILDYHNPKKIQQVTTTTSQLNQKITDENNLNFEIDEEAEDSYYFNHININCYKYQEKLYHSFMKAFSYLPICAIINKTSICLHGGLSPLLNNVEDIRNQIKRPITKFDANLLLSDIVWSDPSIKLNGMYDNNQRGKGKAFSGAALINFLKNNNLKRLIRGHEFVENGIEELFNNKCITVFSASSYCQDMSNSSGVLKIFKENDSIKPIIFAPLKRLKKCDASYYKVQSFPSKKIKHLNSSQILNNKNRFILSFSHAGFDNLNCHYYTSARTNFNLNNDEHESIHAMKNHYSGSIHSKRFNCIINCAHVLIPRINKN